MASPADRQLAKRLPRNGFPLQPVAESRAAPRGADVTIRCRPPPLIDCALPHAGPTRIACFHRERDVSTKCIAVSNNDVILVAWTFAHKLEDCVGCDVRRIPAEFADIRSDEPQGQSLPAVGISASAPPMLRALPLCACCRHYPGAATGRPACSYSRGPRDACLGCPEVGDFSAQDRTR